MTSRKREHRQFADLYRSHVAHLRECYDSSLAATGTDAVVLHSGSLRMRSEFDDQYWPLRPVPHFAHWVPLAWVDCALVKVAGQQPSLVVFRDPSYWEQPREPDWDHFGPQFRVVEVSTQDDASREIKSALGSASSVAFIGEDASRAQSWGFDREQMNPGVLVDSLDQIRTRKTDYEVACMAEASWRAAEGHQAVAEAFWSRESSELELHLTYLLASCQDDAETPYKNIVALGSNAAILHHVSYGREAPRGPLSLLVDAGATCMGYDSDITRTYVQTEGAPDGSAAAFGELIAGVDAVEQSLCSQVRIGMPYEALHEQAHMELATVLRDLDLVRMEAGEMVARGVTRKLFPHGIGHSLGIQTHDVGCRLKPPGPENPFLRNTTNITPGQVFTIEPGIYFIDSLLEELRASGAGSSVNWSLVDALRPFGGVRIEDNILVLDEAEEEGAAPIRNLTREALRNGS